MIDDDATPTHQIEAARRSWRPLAAILAGAMLAASFPPLGWGFLAWFAFVPLLWSLAGATPRQAAGRGYVTGLFFMGGVGLFATSFGGGVLWMTLLPWILFTALEAIWFVPIGIALSVILRKASIVILAGVPAVWTLGEWARGTGTYGFPFGGLAAAAVDTPVGQWASVGGCYMVSAIVALAATALYLLVRGDRPARRAAVWGLLACVPLAGWGTFIYTSWDLPDSDIPTQTVLVAQGDSNEVWGTPESDAAFTALRERTLHAIDRPDLIVWSESSVPGMLPRDRWLWRQTTDIPAQLKAPLLTGAIGTAPSGAPVNSALLIRPDRSVAGVYLKRQLVPWGEFVPGRHVLPLLSDFGVVDRDEEPGTRYNVLSSGDFRIGVPICFESASPRAARAFVREGANLLVIITNDAWFGRRTGMPEQHFAEARLRAIETHRWVVRCGATGISAFIAPSGAVRAALPFGQSGVLSAPVTLMAGRTPFVRGGDWFVLVCLALSAWALWSPMGIHTPRR